MNNISANIQGVGFLALALLIFSLQDVAVRGLGGNYPALEIVAFRSLVALPLTLLLVRSDGGRGLPTTVIPNAVRNLSEEISRSARNDMNVQGLAEAHTRSKTYGNCSIGGTQQWCPNAAVGVRRFSDE
jgi:hypothetical protein